MDNIIRLLHNYKNCDSNCYNTIKHIISEFELNLLTTFESSNVPDIQNMLLNLNLNNTGIYNFNIIFKYKINRRTSIPFNHSFIILKYNNIYKLCDSWSGIHYFNCTFKNENEIKCWLNNLSTMLDNLYVNENFIEFFMKDVEEMEWSNTYPKPSKFETVHLTLNILSHKELNKTQFGKREKIIFKGIKKSTNSKKKYMATFIINNRKKVVHFGAYGMSDYTKHKDKSRKKQYINRHKKREDWNNPITAGALSRWILWNKPTLKGSINDYKRRFKFK